MKAILAVVLSCFTAVVSTPILATPQTEESNLGPKILSCVMHEAAGPWVHVDRYSKGLIQFNYLHEGPNLRPGPHDYRDGNDYLYAAFWNRDHTAGEFLQFIWFREGSKTHLRIVNNAKIISSGGRPDLEDTLWGVWAYEHLRRRLLKLNDAPTQIVSLDTNENAGVLCDSYVHPIRGPAPGKNKK